MADVTKMYRCVYVKPPDQDMQRVLWRKTKDDPIEHYWLTTVTYCESSASFVATSCLKEVADSIQDSQPEVVNSIRENFFYMDDLLDGADTVQEVLKKLRTIHEVLAKAHFPLTKYTSNSPQLLKSIPSDLVAKSKMVKLNSPEMVSSALGIQRQRVVFLGK